MHSSLPHVASRRRTARLDLEERVADLRREVERLGAAPGAQGRVWSAIVDLQSAERWLGAAEAEERAATRADERHRGLDD